MNFKKIIKITYAVLCTLGCVNSIWDIFLHPDIYQGITVQTNIGCFLMIWSAALGLGWCFIELLFTEKVITAGDRWKQLLKKKRGKKDMYPTFRLIIMVAFFSLPILLLIVIWISYLLGG